MEYAGIMEKLKSLANPDVIEEMARFGINPENNLGISITSIRQIARETGKDHSLAIQLWESGIREARMLAALVEEVKLVTGEQMDTWANDFNSWDICDHCCSALFRYTDYAYQKAVEWSSNDKEFVKRAGFVLMATLTVSDKKAPDEKFAPFFELMKRESTDDRNYAKKAVNWALRQIGKRSPGLNKMAIETAREIHAMDSKSARWIATDALRELTGQAVQRRLRR
ncbi:MAG TPA: DNA alkylation repair protein [Dehalococcoidia bacterium]|nr:DNA alkylation repair protein [Dehalococcoidia bacterium]